MKKSIEIIQKYAREFEKLEKSEKYLFASINNLDDDTLKELLAYFTSGKTFVPVNLL